VIESGTTFPLSPLQQGMLFHHLLEPHAGVDLVQIVCSLDVALDRAAFLEAWQIVLQRHEILRASLRWDDVDVPVHDIAADVALPVVEHDLRSLDAAGRHAHLEAFLRADRRAGLALDVPPLMRLALFRTGEAAFEIVWTVHHVLLDGRSFWIVLRDVLAAYESLARGEPVEPSPLGPGFRAYAAWNGSRDQSESEAYWRALLAGFTQATALPVMAPDRAMPAEDDRRRAHGVTLDRSSSQALRELAAASDLPLTNLVQAAWAIVLARQSGECDVVFGATRAARRSWHAEAGASLGAFVTTLPMRVTVDEDAPVLDLARQLRAQSLALRAHEQMPLAAVRRCSEITGAAPLFETLVVFERRSFQSQLRRLGPHWERSRIRLLGQTAYPLNLRAYGDDALELNLQYDAARVDDDSARRILDRFVTVVADVAHGGLARPLREVAWLPAAERAELEAWSRPQRVETADATPIALFCHAAARTPHAVAVSLGERHVTYADLAARARDLARRLQRLGVAPGSGIALCLEPSLETIVAILGVHIAGGWYVPLDPAYPAERLAFILSDTNAAVIVTTAAARVHLPETAAEIVVLEEDGDGTLAAEAPAARAPAAAMLDDAAYVIYTSGSTGARKGVVVTHRNVTRLLSSTQGALAFGPADVWTLSHSYAFDFSVWEIWGALAHGGRLVVVPYWTLRSPDQFHDLLARERVTILNQVPSAFRLLIAVDRERPARLDALRLVIFGGEALDVRMLAPWIERYGDEAPRLINMYGITETTVHTTMRRIRRGDLTSDVRSPIGRALPDVGLCVLDPRGESVPAGVAGELSVRGGGVARGYLNRPELTAGRFLPDERSGDPSARRYRSGDRVRWLPDGSLAYLGRVDDQLEIRGFRIEPGEIEAALLTHPAVAACVVVGLEAGPERMQLAAYVVRGDDSLEPQALRAWLERRLPAHLVPAHFVMLAALPLTANGKIDRRRLPEPPDRPLGGPSSPAVTMTAAEVALTSIFRTALRRTQVGVHDNFFELGGDSLITIAIVGRARRAGLAITPRQVFEHPTIAELARVATVAEAGGGGDDEAGAPGPAPLTPIQRWFFETQPEAPHHWNQARLLAVPAGIDGPALRRAARQVIAHHDVFRSRFTPGEVRRDVAIAPATGDVTIESVDLSEVDPTDIPDAIERSCARAQRSLDLAHGPLVRFVHLRLGPGLPGRLFIAIHHLAVDAVSWHILVEDLERGYTAAARGAGADLPHKTLSYDAWARRLAALVREPETLSQAPYWRSVVAEPLQRLSHATARLTPVESAAAIETGALTKQETAILLQDLPAAYGTRINDVLLTALESALRTVAPSGAMVVDLEGHGREDVGGADLTRTVGWFTTICPVRLELDDRSPHDRLRRMHDRLRAMPDRGLRYGLLRYGDAGTAALAPHDAAIAFNYLGDVDATLAHATLFSAAGESTGPARDPRARRAHRLEIVAATRAGSLGAQFRFDPGDLAADLVAGLAVAFFATLRRLAREAPAAAKDDAATASTATAAATAAAEVRYPLSPMQQLFVLGDASEGAGLDQRRFRLQGPLDERSLEAAWQFVINRYEILRSEFVTGTAEPYRIVRAAATPAWDVRDWRGRAAEHRESALGRLLEADRERGFAFDRAPLMRFALVRLAGDLYEFVWTQHQLLLDRWSWPLVLADVGLVYVALRTGRPPRLEPVVSDAVYARWLAEQDRAVAASVWQKRFEGFVPPPFARPREAGESATGDEEAELGLTAEETQRLRTFAATQRLSFQATVAGAWGLVVAGYAGATDVAIGVVVAGRPAALPDVERIAGVLTNNLPLRVRVEADATTAAWLRALQAQMLDMQEVAFATPAEIQAWSGVPWRTRLFETLVVVHDRAATAVAGTWLGPEIAIEPHHTPTRTGYALSLVVAGGEATTFRATFDDRIFDRASVDDILLRLRTILLAMAAAPDGALDRLPRSPDFALALAGPPAAATRIARARTAYVAPISATETVVAALWSDVLGIDRVGTADDFFALGGQSLIALQLVTRLRESFAIDVPVRTLFAAPTVARVAAALRSLERTPGQVERTATLLRHDHATPAGAEPEAERDAAPEPGTAFEPAHLSFEQETLWLLDRATPGLTAYNSAAARRLRGALDPAALQSAFDGLVARQAALRTTIDPSGAEPVPVVHAAAPVAIEMRDFRMEDAASRERDALAYLRDIAATPFDLARDLPLRVAAARTADDEYLLLALTHHTASDGWSYRLIFEELAERYAAHRERRPARLAPLPLGYAAYASRQRAASRGPRRAELDAFWRAELAGSPATLALPFDRPRSASPSFAGANVHAIVPPDLARGLRDLARRQGTTLFTVLLAAYGVLLGRSSAQDDIVVGTPVATRPQRELEAVVGYFLNTLPIRMRLTGETTFAALLGSVAQSLGRVIDHRDLPYDQVVDAASEGAAGSNFLQAVITLQLASPEETRFDDVRVEPLELDTASAMFDLSLSAEERGEALHLSFEYRTALFERATVARLSDRFVTLLEGVASAPERRIDTLSLMRANEEARVVRDFNDTARTYAVDTIAALARARVAETPERVAVEWRTGDGTTGRLTHAEVGERAERLARRLRARGVGPGSGVAICAERSPALMVAVLGVLAAGGFYVPLDPGYPPDRLAFMLADSAVRIVLCDARTAPDFATQAAEVMLIDGDEPGSAPGMPAAQALVTDAAYLMYTSGSTGRPKGAAISHRSIVSQLRWLEDWYAIGPDDVLLQNTPFSFDSSIAEMLLPVVTGARVVMLRPGGHRDAAYLIETIAAHGVTVMNIVPSVLRAIVAHPDLTACTSLRHLICGGETLAPELAAAYFATGLPAVLNNHYGPTECAIQVSHWTCPRVWPAHAPIPIGRPVANTQIYLLDARGAPVPIGFAGELHVGGTQVGLGYLERPELTARAFIADPFADDPGARLYKTGDLARFREDGALEYLGRADDQVKLRGFRIEPGEIESALTEHPDVASAAAIVRGAQPEEAELVAYFVPRPAAEVTPAALRTYLRAKLPGHMVPNLYVRLDALPLTPSGKLDRKILPAPDAAARGGTFTHVPPRSATERVIARIAGDILRLEPGSLGIDDDFFEAGGHSLLAMRVVTRVGSALRTRIAVRDLFEAPTVRGLAAATVASAEPGRTEAVATAVLRLEAMSPDERERRRAAMEPAR